MTDRKSMKSVDHTHPHTGETFGNVFRRGPQTVADGGPDTDTSESRMEDVDHTPRHGDGANGVWERGATGDDGRADGESVREVEAEVADE